MFPGAFNDAGLLPPRGVVQRVADPVLLLDEVGAAEVAHHVVVDQVLACEQRRVARGAHEVTELGGRLLQMDFARLRPFEHLVARQVHG